MDLNQRKLLNWTLESVRSSYLPWSSHHGFYNCKKVNPANNQVRLEEHLEPQVRPSHSTDAWLELCKTRSRGPRYATAPDPGKLGECVCINNIYVRVLHPRWFATLHHDKRWGYNSSQDKPNSALQGTQTREEMTIDWAVPFSRGSSRPRNRTEASCISGGFFTSWATTEAQPKGRSFQLTPPVAPSSATVILSLQLLGHHDQGEGEYNVQ